jgi:RNA polymerase sigma-70 factor, ECF subfamily
MDAQQNGQKTEQGREIVEGLRSPEREGVEAAARLLFEKFYRSLVDELSRPPGFVCSADAEEIAADALVRLIEQPGIYDPARASLQTFLHVVARNAARDLRRRRKREEARAPLSASPFSDSADEPSYTYPDLVLQLREAVRELPAGTRQATLLHLEGRSHTEIATELRLSVGTVRTRVSRGRSWLRVRLGPR